MVNLFKCESCGSESPFFDPFCSNCGKPTTQVCKACGEENDLKATYCRRCGIELATAPTGLFLARALVWRAQFKSMGWYGLPKKKGGEFMEHLINSSILPIKKDTYNPWIMLVPVDGSDWNPKWVNINNKRVLSTGLGGKEGYVMATRCEVLFLDAKDMNYWILPYKDLLRWGWLSRGDVSLSTDDLNIKMEINAKGAGFLDMVTTVGPDTSQRIYSAEQVKEKTARQTGFMQLIGEFLEEIADVKE